MNGSEWENAYGRWYSLKAHPELVKGCRVWDELTSRLQNKRITYDNNPIHFYSFHDYDSLRCRIEGTHAEVTVGSASGHKAHIMLTPNGWELQYYDTDELVNEVMHKILTEKLNLNCEKVREFGVFCKGFGEEKITPIFKALAMATSMDLRLDFCEHALLDTTEDPIKYCKNRELEYYDQFIV